MVGLYSQYTSGTQFTDGVLAGSTMGVSGLNPIVDRLNSITSDGNVSRTLDVGSSLLISSGTAWVNMGSVLIDGERFKNNSFFRFDVNTSTYLNAYVNIRLYLSGPVRNVASQSIAGSASNGLYINTQGYIEFLTDSSSATAANSAAGFIAGTGNSQGASSQVDPFTLTRSVRAQPLAFNGSDFMIYYQCQTQTDNMQFTSYMLQGTPGTALY